MQKDLIDDSLDLEALNRFLIFYNTDNPHQPLTVGAAQGIDFPGSCPDRLQSFGSAEPSFDWVYVLTEPFPDLKFAGRE